MAASIQSLGIDKLSVEERWQLLDELWDSIADTSFWPDIPVAHQQLLDERLASYRANPMKTETWEEVKAALRASS